MSHTPGPWDYEIHQGYACITHNKASIASAHIEKLSGEVLPMEANARLIASAPDLLHALTKCEAQFRFYADEHTKAGKVEKAATNMKFADLARAALTKATTP